MGKETRQRTTLANEDVPVFTRGSSAERNCLVRIFSPRVGLTFDPFPVGQTGLVIGRDPGGKGNVLIEDQRASRKHAKVSWVEAQQRHSVRDLKSTNGTFLNGAPVDREYLKPGDVVRTGNSLFVYCPTPTDSADDRIFVGRSTAIREAIDSLHQAAPTDLKVLVTGETGTGKELAAQTLHEVSGRTGAFVPVNCGSFPASLIESELFGYVKGAFSGADRSKEGLIAAADGGTLFLDEIGEFPLDLQPRLLRVLQDQEVRPVGATVSKRVDVRVVAATNRDIEGMVSDERFRRDLLARVNEWPIQLPPLTERREDIGLLVRHFLRQRGAGQAAVQFDSDLLEHILLASWEGNVRELSAAVARLSVSFKNGIDNPQILLRQALGRAPTIELPCARPTPPPPDTSEELSAVQSLFEGNISGVSRYYGKERQQVYRWLEKFGLVDS